MSKVGRQTWKFSRGASVLATGTVAGTVEGKGPLGTDFDLRISDDHFGEPSWEKAEQKLFESAAKIALDKVSLSDGDLDLIVGGDLNAQLSSFYFGLRAYSTPLIGTYGACSTVTESLAVAAMAIDSNNVNYALVGTSSHNSTAERQFRYPTEYGVQKPPTAQRTVTGSGVVVLGSKPFGEMRITHATIGKLVDMGISSPWEMGAAMAPAAFDTIQAFFRESGMKPKDFDCIATGDLGYIGHELLAEMFRDAGMDLGERLTDCGMLIYDREQPEVYSGGSGGACCSLVTFGHLLDNLSSGVWNRMLVCATGALLSSVTVQQGETVPGICHAVAFERVSAENTDGGTKS
ncbi:stage V sporulation protein AD [Alicyclobacillus sp. SO9]|uniref:stage V sporulation protein AD n=1 Tax=Alicyclobacillus sp. SO9 TaxID=2665646 RepID=UPI0018E8E61C|nr:stage V sporulation protein AD [Alicyclobacillus sp. SO9]QQE76910.1 stage V sporulation protein AD [Alicyclobacillus sp. SO9]